MATPKRTIKHVAYAPVVGTHVIAELYGCKGVLDHVTTVQEILTKAAQLCGAHILHSKFHKFSPQGLTGYLLLSESHISIHTWPEHGYAAIDVFTCGKMNPKVAVEYIKRQLKARNASVQVIKRG